MDITAVSFSKPHCRVGSFAVLTESDESISLAFTVPKSGIYMMTVSYRHYDWDQWVRLDITNGEETTELLPSLPHGKDEVSFPVPMFSGKNTVTFTHDFGHELFIYDVAVCAELPLPKKTISPINDTLYLDNMRKMHATVCNYGDEITALKAIACEHDDGNACERVADCIFGGNADKYRTFRWNKTDKKKLLIYGGGLGANGVTSTLRYRLDNIDYDKFDVTLVAPKPRGKVALQNCLDFNKNIRMLIRTGYMTSDQDEGPMWNMQKYAPFTDGKIDHVLRRMFKREYMRAFGESRFDYLIDYSGYGPRFSCLFLSSDYGKKIIWQHNDLYSDMNDTEKQSQPMYKNHGNMLRSVISLYPSFDTVVSAGKGCMTQNIKSLREYFALDESTVSRMTYVPNRIGYDEILGKQSQCTVVEKDGKRYYCDNDMTAEPDSEIPPHEIPIPCGSTNFFTIGRLSNEKNCLNLLKAFAAINRDYPDTTLSFIGSGSLEGQLKKLIKKYRLQGKVLLTGQLKNPFGFASLLDCFVFPSRHEGSGMVVYEMRVMHKPVIISNYPVHRDVCCGENGQIVTDMTAEGIADGMRKYLENPKIISYNFDCAAFNAEADERFLQIFE